MVLRIICTGNPLHGSDGIGYDVFVALRQWHLPDKVEVFDGGVGGITMLPFFRDADIVLIIDAASEDAPGSASRLQIIYNAIIRLSEVVTNHGEHGGDIKTLAELLPVFLSRVPRVDLLCIPVPHPNCFQISSEASSSARVDEICKLVVGYANRMCYCTQEAMSQERAE